MSFKSGNTTLSFSDLELSMGKIKNKTHETLTGLDATIEWESVETLLFEHYPVGKKKKGPQAYSPMMLFKCLLLRNWFRISSDAELSSLLNDRFSFKKFVGLPLADPAPDSSTFSRFRHRLTPDVYHTILSDISDQLSQKRLIISMGRASDIKISRTRRTPEQKK